MQLHQLFPNPTTVIGKKDNYRLSLQSNLEIREMKK